VNVTVLESYISKCWHDWTDTEKRFAQKAVKRIMGEIPVKLKYELPPLWEKNAASALENGRQMTDTLADWIRKGFVAGPFDGPPTKNLPGQPLDGGSAENQS
jgi:hypothetical protein